MRYAYGNGRHNAWIGLRNAFSGIMLLMIVNIAIRVMA